MLHFFENALRMNRLKKCLVYLVVNYSVNKYVVRHGQTDHVVSKNNLPQKQT